MAQGDDSNTRPAEPRGPPPGATAPPDHVKNPQIYEIFPGSKPEGRDGSTPEQQKMQRPTITDAAKTIKAEDWLKVHQIPCARQGFLTGIGAGAVIGMGRYVMGARIPKASNWAAGAFMIGSIVQFEVCQYARAQEKAAMARVVEVVDRKTAEKKQKAAEAARLRAEAQEKEKQAAAKSWYKFW
ncbi:hypothetical protein BX600DRAFT_508612 [Xylariales sp. PMI_506]|nr:hypothetical protein BX600DRAFT_508612 [Xylariales sp. PMI_506]